jgi:hypothetical protein
MGNVGYYATGDIMKMRALWDIVLCILVAVKA